ncbi:hypothetical protein CJ030_MR1G008491 [Morella rubra]|uniref:GRF-type domain-containing protein n=1 Tax=Morella rubra TaxID=262757 RepID=A0A6A1WVB7_9ROSI|nr:hypothetical protein CJ030_MR1G008491 [Morella rubra]
MSTSNSGSNSWVTNSGANSRGPQCLCGVTTYLKTSYTEHNFGRRFYSCSKYKIKRECGFFAWFDPPMCEHGKRVLKHMRDRQECLNVDQKNVEILKEDMESLKEEIGSLKKEKQSLKEENKNLKKEIENYGTVVIKYKLAMFVLCIMLIVMGLC